MPPSPPSTPDPLKALFLAGRPCVRIVTFEEAEARDRLFAIASDLNLTPWLWTATHGIRCGHVVSAPIPDTTNPAAALHYTLLHAKEPTFLVTCDLADHLADPLALRALRELIEHFARRASFNNPAHIAMVDHRDDVPPAVASASTRYTLPFPNDAEIEQLVRKTIRELHKQSPIDISLTKNNVRALIENLRGLTRRQIPLLLADAVAEDRALNEHDLPNLLRAKREAISLGSSVLDFVDSPASLDDVAGLSRLKKWLRARAPAFTNNAAAALPTPRGVLLLGVQGSGKSLAAKAIASAWSRPLLRLDPGALYDRFVGESERRLREAFRLAESMAPIVLWIDEVEKGFASAAARSVDGGLSQRLFGSLLTWMQEHRAPVFIVATANDIEALPPELLRKGRFDEIFFIDLPTLDARAEIFRIHLRKRALDPQSFDLAALADASQGFSGAEIEQAVLSSLHEAHADNKPLDTARILNTLRESPPLSVTMAERVSDLRRWSQGRTMPAD